MVKHIFILATIIAAALVFMSIDELILVKVIVVLGIISYYAFKVYPGKDKIKKFLDEKFDDKKD